MNQLSFSYEVEDVPALRQAPSSALRKLVGCRYCGTRFLPVEWMAWRKDGYCSEDHRDVSISLSTVQNKTKLNRTAQH